MGSECEIPTQLDQSNYLGNQLQVLGFAVPFTILRVTSRAKMVRQNYFPEPNQHVLTFLHPTFALECNGGVVLIASLV